MPCAPGVLYPGFRTTMAPMKLVGDPAGIAALKALGTKDRGAVKFLLEEARSNTDRTARFTAADGTVYALRADLVGEVFEVVPV